MARSRNHARNGEAPALRDIMDEEKLAQTLQLHLGADFVSGKYSVERCKIDWVHVTSFKSRILFSARIRDNHTQQKHQQLYFGRIIQPEEERERASHPAPAQLVQPGIGLAALYIPEWSMQVWAYPNDPNLPGLVALVDTARVLAAVRSAPESFGLPAGFAPAAITAEMAKYVPGRRCGYRYRVVSAAHNGCDANAGHFFYGKAYRPGEGEKAFSLTKAIWESAVSQSGEMLLPQPYSCDAANGIVWQEAIAGEPLAKIADRVENLPELAREIGRRLAALHGASVALPVEMTFDYQTAELQRAVESLAKSFPDYSAACNAIGEKLLRAAAHMAPAPLVPVHGSFKFSHIFAAPRGITFIDFDGANCGDAGYDVGRFIAHLYKMKADFSIDPDVAEQTIVQFCEAYKEAARIPMPQERIDWFAASHLVASQAYKAIKRVNPAAVHKLLKMADRLCP